MDKMSFSVLPTVSTSSLVTPGVYKEFPYGIIAKYCKVATGIDGTAIDAHEPVLLAAAEAAWDDPYLTYLVTNDAGDSDLDACVGCMYASTIIGSWGWVVVKGYLSAVPSETETFAIGNPVKPKDNAGAGITVTLCTTDESCIGVALADHATNDLPMMVSIARWL